MGILTRFKDIMSANINSLLDKCEDPSKMIDEYLRQVREELAQVKEETSVVMAEEKRTKREVDANKAKVNEYEKYAEKALKAGNEEDARRFLVKKQEYEKIGVELKKAYDVAKSNADKMRSMHDKLTEDIKQLERRRQEVKSKVAVAKTQEKINKVAGSMNSASKSMEAFDRMEAKADQMLDRANSVAELNEEPVDSTEVLKEKYDTSLDSVDEELAKLKKKLGLK